MPHQFVSQGGLSFCEVTCKILWIRKHRVLSVCRSADRLVDCRNSLVGLGLRIADDRLGVSLAAPNKDGFATSHVHISAWTQTN